MNESYAFRRKLGWDVLGSRSARMISSNLDNFVLFSLCNFFNLLLAGDVQEEGHPGKVDRISSFHATSPSHEHADLSKPDATNHIIIESEAAEVENACNVCGENVDPLDLFLPPPPKEKCTEDLQVSSLCFMDMLPSDFST